MIWLNQYDQMFSDSWYNQLSQQLFVHSHTSIKELSTTNNNQHKPLLADLVTAV